MAPAIKLLTVLETAKELGVSDRRVRQLIDEKILPAERYGRVLLVKRSDLKKAQKRETKRGRKPAKR